MPVDVSSCLRLLLSPLLSPIARLGTSRRDWRLRDRNWFLAILMVASPLRFEFFTAGAARPEHVGHRANSHHSRLDNIVTRASSDVATAVTGIVFL